ncbi:uncharacterized protein LOC134819343 isoform X2 [Bolinopsis microptera]|uniref:uncharacterized protein LOC134819343 isoform X2 n=1 Tax=Bolinopsis microptera TaxID=2820187 RepID=UPI00307A07ED
MLNLFLTLVLVVATNAVKFHEEIKYELNPKRFPCSDEKTVTSLTNSLLDVPEKLICVREEKCRVNFHLPPCMIRKRRIDSEDLKLNVTIDKLDRYDNFDIKFSREELKSAVTDVLSPYLVKDNPCGSGRVLLGSVCRMCLPGTYTTQWNTCDACPVGTYSDSTGVKECSPCPEHQTTHTTGATGMEQCQEKCWVDKKISSRHNLMFPSPNVVVSGAIVTLHCGRHWAFDHSGTVTKTAKCGEPLPTCSVRSCPDPCTAGYLCNSCQCVDINARCDGVEHCADNSDEAACPAQVDAPSSLQLSRDGLTYVSVPRTWSRTSDIAVCLWARLKLSSSFSSLVSFELAESHSLWIQLTSDALYVQLNKMVYKEVRFPYALDRKWFSMCLSVDREFLDLYLDGAPLLHGQNQDISSVQGLEISGDMVIGGMPHESHPPYLAEGLIKDLSVWNKPLSPEQVEEYSKGCLIPQPDDIIVAWSTIMNHTVPDLLLDQTYSGSCSGPVPSGSCPPDMWECGSGDCIPLIERCDRIPDNCLDGSDETGCPLLDGQLVLIEDSLTSDLAEEACLKLGGSLALLSTPYMKEYAKNILVYYDYDKAWSSSPNGEGPGLLTKLGTWLKAEKESSARAVLCQRTRTSVYRYFDTPATYDEAHDTCTGIDGEMATITTKPQFEILQKLITSQQFEPSGAAWVGGGKKAGYLTWDNGDIFSDLNQEPRYVSGDKLSVDRSGLWELRDKTETLPFVCMVETAYNHTTSMEFGNTGEPLVRITDPISGITVLDTTTCASFKSAKANGTIISYATDNNDNEMLVMVTNQALVIMVHNVPYFVKTDLTDGIWHTVCFRYSDEEGQLTIFIDEKDWSIKRTIDPAGIGSYGSMILGAEQDFQEKSTLRKLDKFQYFEGSISNFNMWQALLSKEEMQYLSGTSAICKTKLTKDERIVLRWGDVLNFGSKTVELGSMSDNEMCRSFGVDEQLKLEINGKPVVYEDSVFKLCDRSECEAVDLKLKTSGTRTFVGGNMTVVLSSDESSGMNCDKSSCTLSSSTLTPFLIQSESKRPGETLEPSDQFYFTDTTGLVLRCTTEKCFLAEDEPGTSNLFSTVIERRGWDDWEEAEECKGTCGDSYHIFTRKCLAPSHLSETLKSLYCPGSPEKRVNCQLDTCEKTEKCGPGVRDTKFRGVFKWGQTYRVNYTVDILCPAGNYNQREYPLVVKMKCSREGYYESDFVTNIEKCAFLSESAQLLHSLLSGDVTAGNVLQVTTDMKTILERADDVSALHLEMIRNLTDRALATGNVTLAVQDNIIDAVETIASKVKVDELWIAQTKNQIVRSILEMIDKSADMVDLMGKPGSATIRENIALFVDKVDLTTSLLVNLNIADTSNLYTTELVMTNTEKKDILQETTGIGIYIPASIRSSAQQEIDRVWFSVFKTDRLFLSNETSEPGMVLACNESCEVSGTIVGIGIGKNYGNITNLKDDVRIQFSPPSSQRFNPTASCVYWNVSTSWWSNKGVKTKLDLKNNRVTCEANHLTNFAVLMNVGNVEIIGVHITALQTITLVGGVVSIVCLFLTVVGLAKFKSLRKTPTNQIHISLSFTLMMGLIFLLVGLDNWTENAAICTMFAVLIHYFYLSAISWMMVEGVNLYIAFIQVFTGGQTHFYKKCALFAFGFPAAVVTASLTINFTTDYPTYVGDRYCWLTYVPSLVAFVGPVILMLLANTVIFAFVIKQIFWRKNAGSQKKMDSLTQLRAVLCLMALMGLGWIAGAFTIDGPSGLVFQYIFTIANISQGILIFYFHCASKPDVRNAWFKSFSSTTSWLKKDTTSHSHSVSKRPIISEPVKPQDGVYNPVCSIMGIPVTLKRQGSIDSPDSGYAVEDRFNFDIKGSRGNTPSNHSVSQFKDRGNMGTVIPPATTAPTYSTNLHNTSTTTGRFRRSPKTGGPKEKAEDSPLFPPSTSPPPPPSSSEPDSKDSFDLVSTPTTSPPLMTFSESEKEAAPDTTPPTPCDVIKPPRGVVPESGEATQQEGSMSPASMSPTSMSPTSPTASDDDPFLDRSRIKEPSAPELTTEDRPDSTDSRYKKRRQSLKSPCLPMKSLRGKFEQQNRNTSSSEFAEELEEDVEARKGGYRPT